MKRNKLGMIGAALGVQMLIGTGLALAHPLQDKAEEIELNPPPPIIIVPNAPTDTATDAEHTDQPPPIVQNYEVKPALWLLADEDTTIHLFGTFHLLPKDFGWRTEQFDQIAAGADELIVETTDEDLNKQMGEILPTMILQVITRKPTSERLSEEGAEKWRKLVLALGEPFDEVDSMPVLFAMMGLGLGQIESFGSMGEYGVETVLEKEFDARNAPSISIENGAKILKDLLLIDEDIAITSLEKSLSEWDGENVDTFFEASELAADAPFGENPATAFVDEHNWARGGDVGFTDEDFPDDEYGRELRRIILEDRNRAWAGWLKDRLDRPGKVLVAVGAGHFYGHDSLLVMLEELGLEAERIN